MKTWTHKQLVDKAYTWVLNNASCGIAFKELVTSNAEIPDVIGFGSWDHSVLVEVKASRSDFLRDKKKQFRENSAKGMGRRRYYCCPSGLIKIEELPEGWGLVYVSDTGRATCVKQPFKISETTGRNEWYHHERDREAEVRMMYSALRRMEVKGLLRAIYLPVGESLLESHTIQNIQPQPAPGECNNRLNQ